MQTFKLFEILYRGISVDPDGGGNGCGNACGFGDPHFLVHSTGQDPICFDFNPKDKNEIVLLVDPVSQSCKIAYQSVFPNILKIEKKNENILEISAIEHTNLNLENFLEISKLKTKI